MTCGRARGQFSEHYDRSLPADLEQDFLGHLAGCPSCSAELAEYRVRDWAVDRNVKLVVGDRHRKGTVPAHERLRKQRQRVGLRSSEAQIDHGQVELLSQAACERTFTQ